MGANTSKTPDLGVPLNPRVNYADELARKEGKQKVIDAPVLVRLDQGTVRYRFAPEKALSENGSHHSLRIDKPHQGSAQNNPKRGYFYHATLNDFSEDAAYSKEDEWKFLYVTEGPNRAKQKKLFYVYGKGMDAGPSQGFVQDTKVKPIGQGYQWPAIFKQPDHVYFDLEFIAQDGEIESKDDEMNDIMHADQENNQAKDIQMTLESKNRCQRLKKRLSVRLVKPINHIHIYIQGREIHAGEVIGDLRNEDAKEWNRFQISLTPK